MRHHRGGWVAVTLLALAVLGTAQVTQARFRDHEATSGSFATATLQPPTGLAGTGGTSASLTWTPSTSGWAAGYDLLRSATSGSGYSQVNTVTPVTAAATTDAPAGGTWYYVLRTTFHNWASVRSNEATVTIASGPTTTTYADCTSNAAETTNAGDNNGYEGTPAGACALGGTVATDTDTGTDNTLSCTSNAKDKHRFWGFAPALPGSVSAISGITIRATAGMNNNGGTTWLCVQLSHDGGTTWTAAKSVVLNGTALATYTLGGAADSWGRTWTLAQLGSGQFRVRVIDATSQPNKQVRLDAIQVAVTYTP